MVISDEVSGKVWKSNLHHAIIFQNRQPPVAYFFLSSGATNLYQNNHPVVVTFVGFNSLPVIPNPPLWFATCF
jgi:hypothetical protein